MPTDQPPRRPVGPIHDPAFAVNGSGGFVYGHIATPNHDPAAGVMGSGGFVVGSRETPNHDPAAGVIAAISD